ncbi:MAG TPA: MarR family transcriptional regulator [Anaeromyxobacteraceae bacterium]|nr:MarR family transcriptional regulator [Anaeromyxobacteraceae bacterium]
MALEFTLDLWALVHSLNARSEWMHRTYGVTGPQRMLARVIGLWPACSPGEAARLLRLHPATVTRLAHGLERLGLARRARDRSDARRLCLTLTSRGRRINAIRTGTVEQAVRRALGRAGAPDVAAARGVVQSLASEILPVESREEVA